MAEYTQREILDLALREILDLALSGCASCDHVSADQLPEAKNVDEILYASVSGGWGPEHSATVLFRLLDGRYGVINESEDTSGHGCECNGDVSYFDDLETAIMLGLDETSRNEYRSGKRLLVGSY